MKKRHLATILAIMFSCSLLSARHRYNALMNFGVKAGFSSTIYNIMELNIATMPINEYDARSEISSFFTAFTRFNIKRHYIQTEVSYNICNYSILIPTSQWAPQTNQQEQSATIATQINGIEVPLYYGYHIKKEGLYGMSFYLGPKANFVLPDQKKYTFTNLPYDVIREEIHPINYSLMLGLGINIGNVFLDFSVEYGLNNISKDFTTTDLEGNVFNNGIIFDRRKNALSFSVGFML